MNCNYYYLCDLSGDPRPPTRDYPAQGGVLGAQYLLQTSEKTRKYVRMNVE